MTNRINLIRNSTHLDWGEMADPKKAAAVHAEASSRLSAPGNLRDRIAAALQAADEKRPNPPADPFLLTPASYDSLADAVIATLGLESESKSYFDDMSPGYTMTRYVTEWETDDSS